MTQMAQSIIKQKNCSSKFLCIVLLVVIGKEASFVRVEGRGVQTFLLLILVVRMIINSTNLTLRKTPNAVFSLRF